MKTPKQIEQEQKLRDADRKTEEILRDLYKINQQVFNNQNSTIMEPETQKEVKQSDVLLKQMQENTENLSIVRNEIRDFVDQLYPMPKDPEEHEVKESAEPKSFEEKVQFYLQQQQDILHELKQLKDHLRTFI